MANTSEQRIAMSEGVATDSTASSILDALDDAVLLLDEDNKISALNVAASDFFQFQIGQKLVDAIGGDKEQRRLVQTLLRKAWRERVSAEVLLDSEAHVEAMIALKPLPSQGQRVVVLRDISREKHNERALRELATRDDLTRCYNRRYFMAALEAELERQRRYGGPMTLLLIDIDHFKHVNDRYGHAAGDAALVMLAEVGSKIFRENDVFARVGGEEFAVLLPETSVENGEAIAERFRQQLRQNPIPNAEEDIFLTASIGVASITPVMSPTAALKTADSALYRAKNSGRNRVVTSHAA